MREFLPLTPIASNQVREELRASGLALGTGLMIIVMLMASSCGQSQADLARPPLYLGVGDDVTVSAKILPRLTEAHLDRMIAILNRRGGAMAFTLIHENAQEALTRLSLVPVVGRLDERAAKKLKNNLVESAFKTQVQAALHRPRNASVTDFYGAVSRLNLFLSEASLPAGANKVMVIVSDGIHTVRHRNLYQSPAPDVRVFAVGIAEPLARKLFGDRVLLFESIDAAIDALELIN